MKCATNFCRNPKASGRKICYKCISRRFRENNPMRSAFDNLKMNAKRRGKSFEITYKDFEDFCIKSDYMKGKGRNADSFHVDRKDEEKGYVIGNLQVLTNTENVRKSLNYRFNERGKPVDFHVTTHYPSKERADVPF